MSSEARTLLGDLVVATVELVEGASTVFPERWLRLALVTSAALRGADGAMAVPRELIDALVGTLDDRLLVLRRYAEEGPFDWERTALARSGLEALRDILEPFDNTPRDVVDTALIDQRMIDGVARWVVAPVPDGVPAHHWWWFASRPPSEATLRMSARMRSLMPTFTHVAPPPYRALLAGGFIDVDGVTFPRLRPRLIPPNQLARQHATFLEGFYNFMHLYEVLEPDGSRRPVDLAATGFACARYLANEIRRRPMPRCRIAVTIAGEMSFITFHVVRPNQDYMTNDYKTTLDYYDVANLVIDTHG